MNRSFYFLTLIVLSAAISVRADDAAPGMFMGVGSCSSSNCHGNPNPVKGRANILQNEYVTWSRHDKHSKAYEALMSDDSKRIAHHLGIAAPEEDKLCLQCHSTVTKDAKLGERFSVEDGVSCEACHGAAGGWLQSHARGEANHSANVKAGMHDLFPLDKRATLCASCHFGNDNQNVTHKLIGAGHPRLAFELDTFSMIQPAHWKVDEDYIKRKGPYDAVRSWLTGQLTLARASVNAIRTNKGAPKGPWPELTLFHCYSCHHSLKSNQWKVRDYGTSVGEPTLNLSSLETLREALNVLKPDLSSELTGAIEDLHAGYREGNADASLAALEDILKRATDVVRKSELNSEKRVALLKHFVALAAATDKHYQYEDAEQLAMAISSILASDHELEQQYKSAHDNLYRSMRNQKDFVAEEFTKAAQAFQKNL